MIAGFAGTVTGAFCRDCSNWSRPEAARDRKPTIVASWRTGPLRLRIASRAKLGKVFRGPVKRDRMDP